MDVTDQVSSHRLLKSFHLDDIEQTLYQLQGQSAAVVAQAKCRFSGNGRDNTLATIRVIFTEGDIFALAKACGVHTRIRPSTISLHFRLINESFVSPAILESKRKMAYQRPYNGRWPEYFSFFRTIKMTFDAKWVDSLRDALDSSSKEPCAWTFFAFNGIATWVNVIEVNRTLSDISSLWGCETYGPTAEDALWTLLTVPPLVLAYRHTERHIDLDSGLFLNGVAIRRLQASKLEEVGSLDEDLHHNPFDDPTKKQKMHEHLMLNVNMMHWVTRAGILLLHSKRMVSDWGSYATYSTERRPQISHTVSSLTVGHVHGSAARRYGLTSTVLSRYHSYHDNAVVDTLLPPKRTVCQSWNCTAARLPGAMYVGNIILSYRSEHFLSDAQAADRLEPRDT